MGIRYYSFETIPDISLAKYSIKEAGGIEEVIRAQSIFYRQLNRQGNLFQQRYVLVYDYHPVRPVGQRLKCFLGVEGKQDSNLEDFLKATQLAEFYDFYAMDDGDANTENVSQLLSEHNMKWAALAKQDGNRNSSFHGTVNDKGYKYYSIRKWKMNESARLMGLFRMMKSLNERSIYVVMITPREYSLAFADKLQLEIAKLKMILSTMDYSHRDTAAEKTVKEYEEMDEMFLSNPLFRCSIMTFAESEEAAKLLLDAAASEAVEEGTYKILSGDQEVIPAQVIRAGGVADQYACAAGTPVEMQGWNQFYILSEMVPFSMLPILYPGETIEIPKESAPNFIGADTKQTVFLGLDTNQYPVYLPLNHFSKHAFIAGVPGSGKTNTMLHLVTQLSGTKVGNDIPVLVFEPAKQEYRALVKNPSMRHFLVFAPGGDGPFFLRINPFEFPIGMQLFEYINRLVDVFIGAFDLEPPMPFLIKKSLFQVYKEKGWYPFFINDGTREYPTMQMLFDQVGEILDASDYAPEVKSNLKSVLQVRIGSLLDGEMGDVFNVIQSSVSPEEWMKLSCVIELESMGKDAANFTTLLLVTMIRSMLKLHPKSDKNPRHVILFEEAHNLIGPATESGGQAGNAKVASTKFIVDMLAEVRALNESIVIADQLPTALAPQVTKNTSIKIGHRITASDDRELLSNTMSADGVQMEQMGLYSKGQALCLFEGIQKPFEMRVASYEETDEGTYDSPDVIALYHDLCKREKYKELMLNDYQIMVSKYEMQMQVIWNDNYPYWNLLYSDIKELLKQRNMLQYDSEEYKTANYKLVELAKELKKQLIRADVVNRVTELYLWYSNYISKNVLLFNNAYANEACSGVLSKKNNDTSFEGIMEVLEAYQSTLAEILPDISLFSQNYEDILIKEEDRFISLVEKYM